MPDIRLVPFERRHHAAFAALLTDPDVLRFTRMPDPAPEGFVETWARRYDVGRETGERANFAIEDADGTFLGIAVAPHIDLVEQTAELGYVVVREARGQGVAARALLLLTDWALRLGMQRLYLLIDESNPGSKKVARRAGYRFEGVMRSTYVKPGVRTDSEIWSLLPGDRV